ncbi:MAG: ester cyclase [Thermoleophilaceae bacterium]|jgi:predicted ester cyclase
MGDEENIAAFRRVMEEGFRQGNLDAIDEVVSAEFLEHEPGPGLDLGRSGLKQIITRLRAAFPDLSATIEDVIGSGDKMCFRVTFSGTNEGELMGFPASGRKATWQAVDIVRFDDDGTLLEHWGTLDRLGVLEQLGHVNV